MNVFDNFFEHYCLVEIDYMLFDSMMVCMENFIGEIDLLQHFVVDFVDGFFVHGVSVICAELVNLFICVLCFQHCNVENEFVSLTCSVSNAFDFECKILMFESIGIDFCAFMLNVVCRMNFDMLICNIEVIDLIFLHLEHLLVLEHLVEFEYEIF